MVRRRGGRKRALGTRAPMPVPLAPNDRWSLDFISDQFVCGRRFRILAIFDDCTRECLAAIADTSLSGLRVARELDLLIARRGRPKSIVSDNRDRADQQRDPFLDGQSQCRLALYRARKARSESLHREFQWPLARRIFERDLIHVTDASPPRARRMALRL